MPDNPTHKDGSHQKRIHTDEEPDVRYWTEKFRVSREQLRKAVLAVGPMVDDVAKALKR
jgi:hypothetical protein